ncbi:hypothetical protein WN55_08750 [Dufourea novaeangliae]|uniref:Uncharacterized protein n=1 Tax=Dufourea novaeangliae TaxID=178035 RepID=A0A154NZX2_DUFNO|nr:hypothetical protein WN55_08750 [Dufourea novaeangliae]
MGSTRPVKDTEGGPGGGTVMMHLEFHPALFHPRYWEGGEDRYVEDGSSSEFFHRSLWIFEPVPEDCVDSAVTATTDYE